MKKLKSQWDYSGKTVFFSVVRGLFPCLCTAGILLAVYAVFGLSPFGEKSLSWCDMDQQTVPLLAEFRRVLIEGEDLFRSPGAGGINFWGIFFFFLASPFSVLCTLVPAESLPWFMNWLVLLKMAACAGTAGLLFAFVGNPLFLFRFLPAVLSEPCLAGYGGAVPAAAAFAVSASGKKAPSSVYPGLFCHAGGQLLPELYGGCLFAPLLQPVSSAGGSA